MTLLYPLDDEIFLFSSHAWSYLHRRDGLHQLIETHWRKYHDFHDRSVTPRHPVDTENDPQLARELRDRIRTADALLIVAGMYANGRRWMEFEIDMAVAFDVPIIPVMFNGQERVPKVATRFAWCDPVKWRGNSVRDAVLRFLPDYRRDAFHGRRNREQADLARVFAALNPAPHVTAYPNFLSPGALEHTAWAPGLRPRQRTELAQALDYDDALQTGGFGVLGRRLGE